MLHIQRQRQADVAAQRNAAVQHAAQREHTALCPGVRKRGHARATRAYGCMRRLVQHRHTCAALHGTASKPLSQACHLPHSWPVLTQPPPANRLPTCAARRWALSPKRAHPGHQGCPKPAGAAPALTGTAAAHPPGCRQPPRAAQMQRAGRRRRAAARRGRRAAA